MAEKYAELRAALDARTVPGYEPYKVDRFGRVYTENGSPMSAQVSKSGYASYSVRMEGKPRRLLAHRAVALAWIGPTPKGRPCVAHLDGSKANNHFSNLSWVSYIENEAHKKSHGTALIGGKNPMAKIDKGIAKKIIRVRKETGASYQKLALQFGVSRNLTREVCVGTHWTVRAEIPSKYRAALAQE